ncbi:UNVERIFIED_CONTAM: hypothetical protein Slati_1148400 [Sesamum latifolium]|uniref:Reverse transcriptase domain-containing protein n=1 Tax=Sesamum latifolium TaxID=2727402 RepID=A0AAW2XD21_9LAMI
MNQRLLEHYTAEEVKFALTQTFPFKSPGSDGMPPVFYQRFWYIVGRSTTDCVLNLLNNQSFSPDLNFTHIVLIRKCNKPKNIIQFRLISLCNVVFKLATKIIANRLKPLLHHTISPSQSAFIPGRLITDNVLIDFEANHYLKSMRGGRAGSVAVKLDMSKAYDRLEWSFLERMLSRLGFHHRVITLIMNCVSNVSYSFMLNGSQFDFLRLGRGIHQSDPLSPYLFIRCAEDLSCLLQAEEREGDI